MKRKTLTTAVLAGLTGMAGMVSVSHAVNVNPDGLGQVLLYPYYSARGGNDTFISIVNTTDQAKSVKVRFLEGLNSREVLDFNLYMSPFDVWVSAVTVDEDTGGGKILIPDASCTVPYLFATTGGDDFGEFAFLPFAFQGTFDDGGPQDIERTASGYFEVIEMGTLTDGDQTEGGDGRGSATAATHVDGVPANCQQLVDAWSPGSADPYWVDDPEIDHEAPSGGLFGNGSIINVPEGTMFTYDAGAISNFSALILHTDPGDLLPDLNSGDTTSNVFFEGQAMVDTQEWLTGVEAVSATLMFDRIMNEYVIGGSADARSEWVVTFPTKRFYADEFFAMDTFGESAPVDPFTVAWGAPADADGAPIRSSAGACEPVDFSFWDREERTPGPGPSPGPIVSPEPEEPPPPEGFLLCFETNVVRFAGSEDIPEFAEITKEPRFTTFPLADEGFTEGWVRFEFDDKATRPSVGGDEYVGLPTIGFWVNTFTNGTLVFDGENTLANFGGSFKHRGSRRVQPAES